INNGTEIKTSIKVKQFDAGFDYIVIIDTNNDVYVYGSNSYGQFGVPNVVQIFIKPMKIPIKAKYVACGTYHTVIIDMDDNVLACGSDNYNAIGIGGSGYSHYVDEFTPIGFKAKQVACGSYCTIILTLE